MTFGRVPSTTSEIAIVGAGPAGSAAAYELGRAGARVAIFDSSHPREKPCGGGVTGRALDQVPWLGSRVRRHAVTIRAAHFEDETGRRTSVPMPDPGGAAEASLVVLPRQTFDAALLDAARQTDATYWPSRVTDVRRSPPGIELQIGPHTHLAGLLIGADGATSLVRRRLAAPFSRDQLSIATGYFAHGVTSDEVIIAFVTNPPGYIWSFPRPDHLAIGICAEARAINAATLRRIVQQWIDARGLARGARLEPYTWPIPSLRRQDFAREHASGDDWGLVGDAAGLVDPITREGIPYALRSGRRLAQLILEGASAAPRRYEAWLRDEIYPELDRADRFKPGFFTPAFIRLVLDGVERSPAVRAVMVDLITGRQDYRSLPGRLLRTFEVGLAWRVLTRRWGKA